MLVLSRHAGEEIVIDQDIRIAVVATSRSAVRLGVIAPPSVHVLRQEQYAPPSPDDMIAATIPSNSNASGSSIMAGIIRLAR